jgi:hypothetical protein
MAKETYFRRKSRLQFLSRSFYLPEGHCMHILCVHTWQMEHLPSYSRFTFSGNGTALILTHKGLCVKIEQEAQAQQPRIQPSNSNPKSNPKSSPPPPPPPPVRFGQLYVLYSERGKFCLEQKAGKCFGGRLTNYQTKGRRRKGGLESVERRGE